MWKHRTRDTSGRRVGLFGPGLTASVPVTPIASPLDLPGLLAWYDASNAASLWQDDARTTPAALADDPVGSWDDLSGNGNHATAALTQRPLLKLAQQNGLPALRTDGVNDILSIANTAALDVATHTIFLVAKPVSGECLVEKWISPFTPLRYPYVIRSTGGFLVYAAYDGTSVVSTDQSVPVTGAWHAIACYRIAGNALHARLDGRAVGAASDSLGATANGTPIGIGGRPTAGTSATPAVADFGELIIAGALPLAAIRGTEAYLKAKWATP